MFPVHGILLATHPGSNMGSDANSRRQDNKDKGRFPCDRKLRSTVFRHHHGLLDTIVSMPTMNVNRVHNL
jgi:hypothetical protein